MIEGFERLYPVVFLSSAMAFVVLERVPALQYQPVHIARRWTSNVGLFLIGSAATAVLLPIGIYAFAERQPPGLISKLGLPLFAELVLAFLLLDLWKYWEHRLLHRIPLLWRFHLVHHSDTEVDVTTSQRHHPVEVLLAAGVPFALISAVGLPPTAVGLYLLAASVVTLYSHANVRLPAFIDRALRNLIVTTRVHALHHSDFRAQTDSNYGSVLTIWDRLFGTYVDPAKARIPHFGLSYFHLPKDTALFRVLSQPFLFRRDLEYPPRAAVIPSLAPETAPESSGLTLVRDHVEPVVGGVIGCALVTWVVWPTPIEMTAVWRNSEAYQYAWLVLPMIVYLLGWHRRGRVDLRPDFSGVLLVAVAAVCWDVASLMNIDVGRQFAYIFALQGVLMSTLGWRAYRQLFPAMALMFLMVPASDLLQPALRVLTLESIELFASITGLPHSVDGFMVFIGGARYIVVDECSGLSYVTLAVFLGYCFGLMMYGSFFAAVAAALFGALLGFSSNAIRVNSIVLIDWILGSQMQLTEHGAFQWIALFMTLGALLYVLSRLRGNSTQKAPLVPAAQQTLPMRKFGPVVAGLGGLLIAGTTAGLQTSDLRPPHGNRSGSFPQDLSGWVLVDPGAAWAVDQQKRSESIHLTYRRGGQQLEVAIVEALSPSAKVSESSVTPDDRKIWREKQVGSEEGCVGSNCVVFTHSIWQREKRQRLRHVYFVYSIGNFVTGSKFVSRARQGWNTLTRGRHNPRLIAFTSENPALDIDQLAVMLQAIRAALSGPQSDRFGELS